MIAYQDIIRATEDFDIRYCIGTKGYGNVYRAQLPSGKVVALKKLHGWESEDPAYLKSFENEVQMLSTIHHRNIVKLHGFYLHIFVFLNSYSPASKLPRFITIIFYNFFIFYSLIHVKFENI